MSRRIVIIGHGPAGRTAAGFASVVDRAADITVLNAGEHDIFHPCSLPFAVGGHVELGAIVEKAPYRKITLLNRTRATSVDPAARTVEAVGPGGEERTFGYDALLIATGSVPFVPPSIEGAGEWAMTLRTPADAARIRERAAGASAGGSAIVIGGSAVGIEVASELAGLGLSTTIVEAMPWLMPGSLDRDMAALAAEHLGGAGVKVRAGEPVRAIRPLGAGGARLAVETSAGEIEADVVVLAAGVRPCTDLARAAGVGIGEHGGIIVRPDMATSAEGVFAAGDCVETTDLVTGRPAPMWLAGIATRQGRVAGTVMAGEEASFPGAVGSWVVATRSFMVGGAGLTEARAAKEGFDAVSVKINALLRPHYISEERIAVRLVAGRPTGRVLGGQVLGRERVAETVNYLALAITSGFTVERLAGADWCYAPLASECVVPLAGAADAILRRIR